MIQNLERRQSDTATISRAHTLKLALKYRQASSASDLRERRNRFAHDGNLARPPPVARDYIRGIKDETAHDNTRSKTVSLVVTRLVARSLFIGFFWLLALCWWLVTLFPRMTTRCIASVFIKDKRKHKEGVAAEKPSKKYKISDDKKVRY